VCHVIPAKGPAWRSSERDGRWRGKCVSGGSSSGPGPDVGSRKRRLPDRIRSKTWECTLVPSYYPRKVPSYPHVSHVAVILFRRRPSPRGIGPYLGSKTPPRIADRLHAVRLPRIPSPGLPAYMTGGGTAATPLRVLITCLDSQESGMSLHGEGRGWKLLRPIWMAWWWAARPREWPAVIDPAPPPAPFQRGGGMVAFCPAVRMRLKQPTPHDRTRSAAMGGGREAAGSVHRPRGEGLPSEPADGGCWDIMKTP
jgi:hypothetical protein